MRNRAEAMGFVSGSDWSEEVMGTSAPALALRSGRPVQVSRAEHFAPDVHSWSCSAVPVTHPLTGQVIGIIDVTGGDDAVSSIVLPLLSSTAKAAGAQLSQLFTPQQMHTGTEAAGTRRRGRSGFLLPQFRLGERRRLQYGREPCLCALRPPSRFMKSQRCPSYRHFRK